MGNFLYPIKGEWGCLRCEVIWRGTNLCWLCSKDDQIVGANVVMDRVRTEEMKPPYSAVGGGVMWVPGTRIY